MTEMEMENNEQVYKSKTPTAIRRMLFCRVRQELLMSDEQQLDTLKNDLQKSLQTRIKSKVDEIFEEELEKEKKARLENKKPQIRKKHPNGYQNTKYYYNVFVYDKPLNDETKKIVFEDRFKNIESIAKHFGVAKQTIHCYFTLGRKRNGIVNWENVLIEKKSNKPVVVSFD